MHQEANTIKRFGLAVSDQILRFYFRFLFLAYLLFSTHFSFSQLPDTDIWLFDMKEDSGTFTFSNPINITNRKGYDNQPAFSPDGKYILYTSIREDKQADIYKYDIKSKQTTQFTKTLESEYSPTFMPGGKFISTVRVEKDSAQRLWKFPVAGGEPSLIMDKVDSIGYHCWTSDTTLALFILTKPFTLQMVNIKEQKAKVIATDIGRCLVTASNKRDFFFTEVIDSSLLIHKANADSLFDSRLPVLKGSEFLVATNDFLNREVIFMGRGGILFSLIKTGEKSLWKEVTDFSFLGINKIGRLTISTDGKKIAIVNTTSQ